MTDNEMFPGGGPAGPALTPITGIVHGNKKKKISGGGGSRRRTRYNFSRPLTTLQQSHRWEVIHVAQFKFNAAKKYFPLAEARYDQLKGKVYPKTKTFIISTHLSMLVIFHDFFSSNQLNIF